MAKIIGVEKGSVSDQLGIKPGDCLLAFDGHPIKDILDYHYYDEMEEFVMTVSCGNEIVDFEIEKDDYYYIKNIEGLMNEVQMNSYEFHIWGSKVPRLKHPDLLVFDLDPDELMSLKKIRDGVRDLKSILDDLKLDSYLKTSGGKGYHIVVPISNVTLKEYKEIALNIAKLMEAKWPDKYTSNIRKESRKGKIFIDYLRNSFGATSVAPYSMRLRKKPTISVPIPWSDLDNVKPDSYTIKDINELLKKPNPWPKF